MDPAQHTRVREYFVGDLLDDEFVYEQLRALPRCALIAMAARAGRYAERILQYDWRINELHAAASRLLGRCELAAAHGIGEDFNRAYSADERDFELLARHWHVAPRPASRHALSSIRDAHGALFDAWQCALGEMTMNRLVDAAGRAVTAARDAWQTGLISPAALAVLELPQRKRPGESVMLDALERDLVRLQTTAVQANWSESARVPRDFFG